MEDREHLRAPFRKCLPSDYPGLLRMYETFEPKGAYQGLPPAKAPPRENWLTSLLHDPANTNFVLCDGDMVFGHAALVYYPHLPREQEIIIFVHQSHQHRGWGRALFLATMNWACLQLSLKAVWLTVDWHNTRALRLYESIGFARLPTGLDLHEVVMERELTCGRCLREACPIYSATLAARNATVQVT